MSAAEFSILNCMTVKNDDVCRVTEKPPLSSTINHDVSHCLHTWLVWMGRQMQTELFYSEDQNTRALEKTSLPPPGDHTLLDSEISLMT